MFELTEHTASEYLRQTGRLQAGDRVQVTYLSGGVSNQVLLVESSERPGERYVLKQARGQLRVAAEWFCSVERIWREVAYLQACQRLLDPPPSVGDLTASTPAVLWEDRENYVFAMQAAPDKHTTWKARLLTGDFDERLARLAGRLLGQLHARTWRDPAIAADFAEYQYFDDLRIDPYYRQVARVHPELEPAIGKLIRSLEENRCCLVHGDFSPKNLLVHDAGMMLIDCEVGHYGDPAFDLGFMLTHLLLKECLQNDAILEHSSWTSPLVIPFIDGYSRLIKPLVPAPEFQRLQLRMRANWGGCLLARLAGKSPVEYRDRLPVERLWTRGCVLLESALE